MKTLTLIIDMGATVPLDIMKWEKPVPMLIEFNYGKTPLGAAKLFRDGNALKAECHFTAWLPEFELTTPAIGGLRSDAGFTVQAVSFGKSNKDPRIKSIGEQIKALKKKGS